MAVASHDRVRADLIGLRRRGTGVREFSLSAARILARAVPFDGVCVLTMDPSSGLATGEIVENGLPQKAIARMTELETQGDDFNAFGVLALSERSAATLSEATNGDLDRSRRHRELRGPNGFGDELRAALVSDAATWGAITLLRGSSRANFEPTDATLVASVSRPLAEGLRDSTVLSALSEDGRDPDRPAGLVVLAGDNSIALTNAAADVWLAELRERDGQELPSVIGAVATRARSGAPEPFPRARVCTASGHWLLVRGSTLGESQTAVIIEPAGPAELAPLIADAYGLTERERAVTQLVAEGLQTNAIAKRLHISSWTVQDHLKTIFEKVDVTTRGELIARVFFGRRAPRLDSGRPTSLTW